MVCNNQTYVYKYLRILYTELWFQLLYLGVTNRETPYITCPLIMTTTNKDKYVCLCHMVYSFPFLLYWFCLTFDSCSESIVIRLGDSNRPMQKVDDRTAFLLSFKIPHNVLYVPPLLLELHSAFTFNQDDRKNTLSCKIQMQHREALKGNQDLPCLYCCIMSAWAVTKDVCQILPWRNSSYLI